MTDKQLELREYLSFSRGDRVSFYFKNGTVMTGVVLTKAEIKSDPTTGQYYELIIQVDEYSAKIDSRHVERIWKDPKVYFEENNNIMGKNWICEEYGIDKNLEDQEFVDQLLERWNSYTLGQQYIVCDLLAASDRGEIFKMIIDSALDAQKIKEKVIADLSKKYAAACGIIGTGALIGVVAGLLLEDKYLEEGQQ